VTTSRLRSAPARLGTSPLLQQQASPSPRSAAGLTAWAVILGFVLTVAVALATGRGGVLEALYPALGLGVGALLLTVRPHLFFGFVLWLWFLSPFVRRIAEYQSEWQLVSPILATPLLITALCGFTVVRHMRELPRATLFPFAIALAACVIGFMVGIPLNGVRAAAYGLGTWIGPILLGIYLQLHWRHFPAFRAALLSSCACGLLVIGIYGVWQYFDPPMWDRFWMIHSDMGSIGHPLPRQVRVFSVLNSPVALAITLLACILLMVTSRHPLRWLASLLGSLALLLSKVRSVWLVGIVALLFLIKRLPGRQRIALLAVLVVLVGAVQVALTYGGMDEAVRSRAQTLTDISDDMSYQARLAFTLRAAREVLDYPLGRGLGSTGGAVYLTTTQGSVVFDNGVLDVLYSLGWLGGVLFLGALAWTCSRVRQASKDQRDGFSAASLSVMLAIGALLVGGNSLNGIGGIFFWGLAGLVQGGMQLAAAEPEDLPDLAGI
jgi:O-Antigen ligase